MRKRLLLFLPVFLIMLSGCVAGGEPMQDALAFRQKLLASEGCRCTADVTADYGDYLFTFRLDCVYSNGTGEVTVIAPEEISGIRAACTGDAASISFDGAILELGSLSDGAVAPLSIPWLFGSAWESDEIIAVSTDEDQIRMTIQKGYDDEKIILETWLSDGVPYMGELTAANGRRELSVTFHDFQFIDGKP